jgi:large subunit ribosomal protein L31
VKEGVHPEYRKVLFVDVSTGNEWVSRSTTTSTQTKEVDGEELPVIRLEISSHSHEISSHSHPFWTGRTRELDADGKIDRFRKRYGKKNKKS